MAYIDNDAKSYGDALFMLADELNQADEMKDDLATLCKTINENPDYLKSHNVFVDFRAQNYNTFPTPQCLYKACEG